MNNNDRMIQGVSKAPESLIEGVAELHRHLYIIEGLVDSLDTELFKGPVPCDTAKTEATPSSVAGWVKQSLDRASNVQSQLERLLYQIRG